MERVNYTPRNYSEWVECLCRLGCENVTTEEINEIVAGEMPGFHNVSVRFCDRLTETVNQMLNMKIKQTTKQINRALGESDLSMLDTIISRNTFEMNKCFFFNELAFLPSEYCHILEREINKEIARYWKSIIRYFQAIEKESHREELLDTIHLIKRRVLIVRKTG